MRSPRHPSLYQINTRAWLADLALSLGRPATLDDVPDAMLDRLAEMGFDWIWLLGVWCTGTASRDLARANQELRHDFVATLPDVRDEDIVGSSFAITRYAVDPSFGGDEALGRLRERLAARGLRLMLDFVPNHTALDHGWVESHPEYYLSGFESDLTSAPQNFVRIERERGDVILAHGRDPNFSGWRDTLQLDYSSDVTQEAMMRELLSIATRCDGVRCDMAMLLLPDVFERTWGRRPPLFWPEAMRRVRAAIPTFCFMAEVYWDLEWIMLRQGFDFAYDKRHYDRLREGVATPVREHLNAPLDYQSKLVRFLENHDEPRAAAAFSPAKHQAAAIATYLLPGMRLFHQGQFGGRQKHISMHLNRAPVEPIDEAIQAFYAKLLELLRRPIFRDGRWELLECQPAWDGNWTLDCFIVWAWLSADDTMCVVVVNYAANHSQCYIEIPDVFPAACTVVQFSDLAGTAYEEYERAELISRGLYLDLLPWSFHVFAVTALP